MVRRRQNHQTTPCKIRSWRLAAGAELARSAVSCVLGLNAAQKILSKPTRRVRGKSREIRRREKINAHAVSIDRRPVRSRVRRGALSKSFSRRLVMLAVL